MRRKKTFKSIVDAAVVVDAAAVGGGGGVIAEALNTTAFVVWLPQMVSSV